MPMPRFTAEVSLYRTSGQYQIAVHSNNLPITIGLLHPARDEVIEVHSCVPGWSDIGGSCWPNPLTESSGGGGESAGSGAEPGGEGGEPRGGGSGGKPPKDKPKPQRPQTFKPTPGGKCNADQMLGGKVVIIARGHYSKLPGDIWFCSGPDANNEGSVNSVQCAPEGTPIENQHCFDRWPL